MRYHSFLSKEDSAWGEQEVIRFRWILITAILILIGYIFLSGNIERGFISLALAIVYIFYNSVLNLLLKRFDNASWIRYVSSTIDVTILSAHVFNYSYFFTPIAVATAPSLFLFAILIMLSVLRYDGTLVIFTTAYVVLCTNIIYFIRYPEIDPALISQIASGGPEGAFYRSVYFILMGYFMFSIPKMINRLVEKQNKVNKERREIEIKLALEKQRRELTMHNLMMEKKMSAELQERKTIIQNQNNKLKQLVSTKDKLFSIIGHDLRSPLCIQSSLSEYMIDNIDKIDKDTISQYLNSIHKTASDGLNMLSNLIDWSCSQNRLIKPLPQKINVKTKIQDIVNQQSEAWKAKNIDINIDIQNSVNTYADDQMFESIVRNLLSNAIKFTPNKGKVIFCANQEKEGCVVKITDSGVGMNEQQINSLFSYEKTISSLGTNNEKGTGLGLILCKEMIDKNNGQINVVSAPGKGTQFVLTLPLTPTS